MPGTYSLGIHWATGHGGHPYKHLQDLLTSKKANSYCFDSYTFIYYEG